MRSIAKVFLCGVVVALSATAQAATVRNVAGSVLVDRGSGFQRVTGDVTVAPGDRVLANAGGSANIVYSENCIVKVDPGAVVTVIPASQCLPVGGLTGVTPYVIGAAVVGGGAALAIGLSGKSSRSVSP